MFQKPKHSCRNFLLQRVSTQPLLALHLAFCKDPNPNTKSTWYSNLTAQFSILTSNHFHMKTLSIDFTALLPWAIQAHNALGSREGCCWPGLHTKITKLLPWFSFVCFRSEAWATFLTHILLIAASSFAARYEESSGTAKPAFQCNKYSRSLVCTLHSNLNNFQNTKWPETFLHEKLCLIQSNLCRKTQQLG